MTPTPSCPSSVEALGVATNGLGRTSWLVMACRKPRGTIILFLGFLTPVTLLLPLSQAQACVFGHEPTGYSPTVSAQGYVLGQLRPKGVALLGSFFSPIIACTVCFLKLLGFRSRRPSIRTSVTIYWVWTYALLLGAQATGEASLPWLFMACPADVRVWYWVLRIATHVAYAAQVVVLAQLSLVQLASSGYRKARLHGRYLLLASLGCAAVTCTSYIGSKLVHDSVLALYLCQAAAGLTLLTFMAFHCKSLIEVTTVVPMTRVAAARGDRGSLNGVRHLAWFMGLSLLSTLLRVAGIMLDAVFFRPWTQLLYELLATIDVPTKAALVLFCTGDFCPMECASTMVSAVNDKLEERRRSQILMTVRHATEAVSGPARSLAALFEGMDEETVMNTAISRFRCISWNVLKEHRELIVSGGALDGATSSNVYDLSQPCKLAACDAFWSHSWHDDGVLKFEELSVWCEAFMERNDGRAPSIWFDRVCIDQTNIERDLQCLPIFLAGCNHLLVTCGHTYITRLWCCVELFVYMSMLVDDETRTRPIVRVLGRTEQERGDVIGKWRAFDITRCECFSTGDKKRILHVVEQCGGSLDFNTLIQRLGSRLCQPSCSSESLHSTWSALWGGRPSDPRALLERTPSGLGCRQMSLDLEASSDSPKPDPAKASGTSSPPCGRVGQDEPAGSDAGGAEAPTGDREDRLAFFGPAASTKSDAESDCEHRDDFGGL